MVKGGGLADYSVNAKMACDTNYSTPSSRGMPAHSSCRAAAAAAAAAGAASPEQLLDVSVIRLLPAPAVAQDAWGDSIVQHRVAHPAAIARIPVVSIGWMAPALPPAVHANARWAAVACKCRVCAHCCCMHITCLSRNARM